MSGSPIRFPSLLLGILLSLSASAAERVFLTSARPIRIDPAGSSNFHGADFDGDGRRDFVVVHPKSIAFHRGLGDGTFAAPVVTSLTSRGSHLAAGDVNGDGKLDLAVDVEPADRALVLLNDGAGRFVRAATVMWNLFAGPMAFGEFTGDGKLDLVGLPGRSSDERHLMLFPGDGHGNFGTAVVTPPPTQSTFFSAAEVIPADLDHDGKLDLFAASEPAGAWFGNGDGTFRRGTTTEGGRSAALADFNRDGFLDSVVADIYLNYVVVAMGSTAGPVAGMTKWRVAFDSDTVTTADMNGDGLADIVALALVGSRVSILLGRGDGTFHPTRMFLTGPGGYQFDVADYDGDAKADVLSVDYNDPGVVSFLRGNGDGTLHGPESFLPRTGVPEMYPDPKARGLRLADLTGDGKVDVLTVTKPEAAFPLDITVMPGDGTGRFGTPIHSSTGISGWTGDSYVSDDFNGDGRLDVVFSSGLGEKVTFFAGNGDGTFTRGESSNRAAAGTLLSGDFTNDGKPDLLIRSTGPTVYPGIGNGTFGPGIVSMDSGSPAPGVVADANRDGNLDYVVNASLVYLGDGTGKLTRMIPDPDERSYDPVGFVDLDEDGIGDSISQGYSDRSLRVRRGRGDGTFLPVEPFRIGIGAATNVWADINRDGHIDLVAGASIFFGDGNGSFEGFEAFRYRGGPRAVAAADLDGDETPDIAAFDNDGYLDVLLTGHDTSLEIPTALALASSKPVSRYGQMVTWTAEVSASSAYKQTSAVRFEVDGKPIGIVAIDAVTRKAEVSAPLETGTHHVTATALRNDLFGEDSASIVQNVERGRASIGIQSENPASVGRNVTFTLAVWAEGGSSLALPTGAVTLSIDGTQVSAFTIGTGTMRYTTAALTVGTHTVKATYGGDAHFDPATRTVEQVITLPPAALGLNMTPRSGLDVQTPVTLTAFVLPSNATGSVTFRADGGRILGTAPVVGGTAVLHLTLPRGPLYVFAVYSGDSVWGPASSSSIFVEVTGLPRRRSTRP